MKNKKFFETFDLVVREGGIEPPRPCGQGILSPSRLPVPPLSLRNIYYMEILLQKQYLRI